MNDPHYQEFIDPLNKQLDFQERKIKQLEKSLNKLCVVLEEFSRFTPKGSIIRTAKEWEEWSKLDGETN